MGSSTMNEPGRRRLIGERKTAVSRSWLLACLAVILHRTDVCAQLPYPVSVPTPSGSPAPVYQRHTVAARDGIKLAVHEWRPAEAADHAPAVMFVHGIGMHGEPYSSVAVGLTARGLTFVVPDLRGHGRSEGKRSELVPPHVLRADLGAVIGWVEKRHPGAPIVLAGESMGGLLAVDYAWRGERPVPGAALLAPAFAVHPAQVVAPEPADLLTPGMVSLDAEARLRASTREPGFIKARRSDPLALHKVSASYLATIAALQVEWALAGSEIKSPVLVCVGGQERIVYPVATRRVFDRLGTPALFRRLARACDVCRL
jgi:alpha-beta hydrolase superfamily lysophospholipase